MDPTVSEPCVSTSQDDEAAIKSTCMYIGTWAQPGELKLEPVTEVKFDLTGVTALMAKISKSIIASAQQEQPKEPKKKSGRKMCYYYNSAHGCLRKRCRYEHVDQENGGQQKKDGRLVSNRR